MKLYQKATLSFLLIFFFSCAGQPSTRESSFVGEDAISVQEEAEKVLIPPTTPISSLPKVSPQDNYLTIIAAGDNLYHEVMIREGEDGDYDSAYDEVSILAKNADIAFINQETLLAGNDFGFSGYPLFNSPKGLGKAISSAGFNVINHATNHIMDKGEKAVLATLDFWDTIPETTILGIHRSEEERTIPRLIKKNNITMGFLSYTYGTNGISIPQDKTYLVSLIDTEMMAEEIDSLRPLCDFLIVSMHWGDEYQTKPNKKQEDLAAFLAEHQVDLVIGHHPHVIQKMEYILRPDGRFMLCYYSLGNFLSAQTQTATLLGALAYIKIKKTSELSQDRAYTNYVRGNEDSGDIVILEAGAIPIVTHYEKNFTGFMAYPLDQYTEELSGKHRKNQEKTEFTPQILEHMAKDTLGNFVISSELLHP